MPAGHCHFEGALRELLSLDVGEVVCVGVAFRASDTTGEDCLYCARATDRGFVRLAIPQSRVFAPVGKTRSTLLLAGLVGACGILMLFLFVDRILARNRALARERDEQARKFEELRRAEAFRRDFVSDVTHEIKTPLTGILAAVDMLQEEDASDSAERRALTEMIRRESTRLNNLVQDVLLVREGYNVPEFLPLHLCNLGLFVNILASVTRGRARAFLAEVSLVLILPGSVGALLFPDWTYRPFWSPVSMLCFFTHSLIVFVPLVFLVRDNVHVSFKHFWYSYLFLALVTPPIYFIDRRFGVNYFFRDKNKLLSLQAPTSWGIT